MFRLKKKLKREKLFTVNKNTINPLGWYNPTLCRTLQATKQQHSPINSMFVRTARYAITREMHTAVLPISLPHYYELFKKGLTKYRTECQFGKGELLFLFVVCVHVYLGHI